MKVASAGRGLVWVGLVAMLLGSAATFAVLVEDGSSPGATDQGLSALFLTALPVGLAVGIPGADKWESSFVAFGEDRRRRTLRHFLPLLLGVPLLALLFAILVLMWTRGTLDARFWADALATAPVALVGAEAMLLVALAALAWFGRIGLYAMVFLLLTLGQMEVAAAALLPSAHVRHLIGVGAPLPFDPGWSMAALWGFSLLGLGAWIARVPR